MPSGLSILAHLRMMACTLDDGAVVRAVLAGRCSAPSAVHELESFKMHHTHTVRNKQRQVPIIQKSVALSPTFRRPCPDVLLHL